MADEERTLEPLPDEILALYDKRAELESNRPTDVRELALWRVDYDELNQKISEFELSHTPTVRVALNTPDGSTVEK